MRFGAFEVFRDIPYELTYPEPEASDDPEKSLAWDAPQNTLMMQGFEWHVPADQKHWYRLKMALPSLLDAGVDNIWIPPGCKGMDPSGTGYDVYDLYDIGEFDQKGSISTRWGSKEDLQALVEAAHDVGIGIYWDTVLNHKAGADFTEKFSAVKANPDGIMVLTIIQGSPRKADVKLDRNIVISKPESVSGWVGFDFPGRKGKYSTMKYSHRHFNGVDWDESRKQHAVYKISKPRKDWAQDVSDEHGNYDFLMFANLDHTNPEVRADIFKWAEWIGTELPISGMRIDAAKHYSVAFQKDFVDHLRNTVGTEYFIVSEYWRGDVRHLLNYLKVMEYGVSLFDVPLLGRFAVTSKMDGSDLRKIFRGTLVEQSPAHAVVRFSG